MASPQQRSPARRFRPGAGTRHSARRCSPFLYSWGWRQPRSSSCRSSPRTRLAASLARDGSDISVSISAFPAEELLFGEADSVTVHVGRLVASSRHVGSLLARTAPIGSLTARVGVLDTHGLVLRNVTLEKRGDRLMAGAGVSQAAIERVLPVDLTLLPNQRRRIVVRGQANVFGHHLVADAEVQVNNGKIVLRPDLSGSMGALDLLHVTAFSNPAVSVNSLSVKPSAAGYVLAAVARYR